MCSLAQCLLYAHRSVTPRSYRFISSSTRQLFTLYQVQFRAQVDTVLYCVLCWFSPNFSHIMTAVKIRKLDIFYRANVDQTVRIHDNSSDCKVSKLLPFARAVYLDSVLLITRSVICLCSVDRFFSLMERGFVFCDAGI